MHNADGTLQHLPILVPSVFSTSICIGDSLNELLSTPLDGAGDGERVGPSESQYILNHPPAQSFKLTLTNNNKNCKQWNLYIIHFKGLFLNKRISYSKILQKLVSYKYLFGTGTQFMYYLY